MKKIDGVYQAKDLTEEIWSLYKGETETTHSCGFKSIDRSDKNKILLKEARNLYDPSKWKNSKYGALKIKTFFQFNNWMS